MLFDITASGLNIRFCCSFVDFCDLRAAFRKTFSIHIWLIYKYSIVHDLIDLIRFESIKSVFIWSDLIQSSSFDSRDWSYKFHVQDLSVQIILYRKQCQKCVLHLLSLCVLTSNYMPEKQASFGAFYITTSRYTFKKPPCNTTETKNHPTVPALEPRLRQTWLIMIGPINSMINYYCAKSREQSRLEKPVTPMIAAWKVKRNQCCRWMCDHAGFFKTEVNWHSYQPFYQLFPLWPDSTRPKAEVIRLYIGLWFSREILD